MLASSCVSTTLKTRHISKFMIIRFVQPSRTKFLQFLVSSRTILVPLLPKSSNQKHISPHSSVLIVLEEERSNWQTSIRSPLARSWATIHPAGQSASCPWVRALGLEDCDPSCRCQYSLARPQSNPNWRGRRTRSVIHQHLPCLLLRGQGRTEDMIPRFGNTDWPQCSETSWLMKTDTPSVSCRRSEGV